MHSRSRRGIRSFYINYDIDSKVAYEILKENLDINSVVIEVRLRDPEINDRVGFVIVNEDALHYTGAGFRGDGRGEGGHYYSKAVSLLNQKGVELERPIVLEKDEDLSVDFVETLRLAVEERGFDFDCVVPIGG
jgi:hypothetical protein